MFKQKGSKEKKQLQVDGSARTSSVTIPKKTAQTTETIFSLCDKGDISAIKQFAKLNSANIYASLNTPIDGFGNTALHFSIVQGDAPLCFMLLLKGVYLLIF
jgi:hypothetical protein